MFDKPLNLYQSLGKSLEDYIEVVYDLHQEKGEARISDISTRLSLAKPSVNAAIKKLVSLGLVKHELYGGVDLTDEGKALAGNVRHKHNILLRFLEKKRLYKNLPNYVTENWMKKLLLIPEI